MNAVFCTDPSLRSTHLLLLREANTQNAQKVRRIYPPFFCTNDTQKCTFCSIRTFKIGPGVGLILNLNTQNKHNMHNMQRMQNMQFFCRFYPAIRPAFWNNTAPRRYSTAVDMMRHSRAYKLVLFVVRHLSLSFSFRLAMHNTQSLVT